MSAKVIDQSGWNYTPIPNDILEDEDLTIHEKMLYICLKRFANTHTDLAFPGVRKLASMAGMSERKAREVIGTLEAKKYIQVERREHQTSIYTILPIPSKNTEVVHEMQGGGAGHAGGVVHTVQGGGARGADELKKQELKKLELNKDSSRNSAKRIYCNEDLEMIIALRLENRIKENDPGFKAKNLQTWANDVRLMIERDNREANEIERLIDWAQNDQFWRSNILSIRKLRDKYTTLLTQSQARNKSNRREPEKLSAEEEYWRINHSNN